MPSFCLICFAIHAFLRLSHPPAWCKSQRLAEVLPRATNITPRISPFWSQTQTPPPTQYHPLTVALNLNSRVILGLFIPDQKFVAISGDISRNLMQNLTRTAWESGIFHGYLVAFLLHWFKGVNPETYLSKCSESAYVVLQVDFSRLITYFGQFNCPHLPHKSLRRSWVTGALRQTPFWAAGGPGLVLKEPSGPTCS